MYYFSLFLAAMVVEALYCFSLFLMALVVTML